MAFDILSWGLGSTPKDAIPKILENFRAIAQDGIAGVPLTVYTKEQVDAKVSADSRVNIISFGAHSITEAGYGSFDSTTAIRNAIDSLPSMPTTIVGKGTYNVPSGKLIIPRGIWYIPSGITISDSIDIECFGSLLGDLTVTNELDWLHFVKIDGLNCTNLILGNLYACHFSNMRIKEQLSLCPSIGNMYNTISHASAGNVLLDVSKAFVNQNAFESITAFGSSDAKGFGLRLTGVQDCQNNSFSQCDFSYGQGITNESLRNQNNTLYGLYLEHMENGPKQNLIGNFDIVNAAFPFAGTETLIRDTWQNSMLFTYGIRSGEHISMSTRNKALGGEWDLIQYGNMGCIYQPQGLGVIGTDITNPAGTEMIWTDTFIQGQSIIINLGKFPGGFLNCAILFKGDFGIGSVTTGLTADGTDAIAEFDIQGNPIGNGWNILRISRTTETNNAYSIILTVNAGTFAIGGVIASTGKIVGLPTASPTCKEVSNVNQPTVIDGTEIDIVVPFKAHFSYVTNFNYSIVDSGQLNTNNLVSHYIKSVSATQAIVHVKYIAPFSCYIQGEATGNIK